MRDIESLSFQPYMRKTYMVEAAYLSEEGVYLIRTATGEVSELSRAEFAKLYQPISTPKPPKGKVFQKKPLTND